MKRIGIISILVLALGAQAFAQFSKGTFLVGGAISGTLNTDKTKSGSTTTTTGTDNSISTTAQAGYFLMNNFALGVGLNRSSETYKAQGGGYKIVSNSGSFNPFARYYYQNFYGQLEGQFGLGNTKTTSGPDVTESKYNVSGWSLAAGYAWLLNDHVAVEPQVGYQSYGNKYTSGGSKDIYSGPFIRVAFQIYLKK